MPGRAAGVMLRFVRSTPARPASEPTTQPASRRRPFAPIPDLMALVARFGGIPLKRQKLAVLTDRLSTGPVYPNKELIRRLLAGRCELCGRTDVIEVHHIRTLAELNRLGQPPPPWAQAMAKRRRKSLVVCGDCHGRIHGAPVPLAG